VPNDPGCTFLVRRQLRPAAASRPGYDAAMPEIGLVGLGRMGLPICANLVRAGYRVLAGDLRPEAGRQAAGCGARWVPEVGRLAAGADVLITVLPGPGEVRELMLGTGGAAAALRPGTTWIDMTSNSPTAVTEIRDTLLGPCAGTGRRTGNCWASRCSKSKPASGYGTRQPRTDHVIYNASRPGSECDQA